MAKKTLGFEELTVDLPQLWWHQPWPGENLRELRRTPTR